MNRNIVIVGAGVSGLTLAERLTASEKDISVTVLERENSPGGLARTFERDGFIFDIGPHRFHTSDPAVRKYLLDILGDDYVSILRSSNVYMSGRYRSWPLTMKSVIGLPLPILLRSLLDLFRKKSNGQIHTFAEYVISKYGINIYDYFFKEYTEKFTGCRATELHPDWAEAGVNRAVIDKNIKADNLFALLKGLLIPKPVSTMFYYPSYGGIQTFCDKQVKRIRSNGGTVIYGCEALGIITEGGKAVGVSTRDRGTISADHIYWSAPISILFPDAGFRFMDTLICNIALSRKQSNDYQWCYFGQQDILFSRLTIPRNFRPDMVPENTDSIIVEITLGNRDYSGNPDLLKDRLIEHLEKVNALRASDIIFMDWRIVPKTYPLYDLAYRNRFSQLKTESGLELTGRCGSFWYNNMDHSIGEALALSSGSVFIKDFWK